MRIADTSALYAAFVTEDAHHAKARAAFAVAERTLIPSETLAETLALLQMRIGFEAAQAAGRAIRNTPHIRIMPAKPTIVESAWEEFERARGKLSLPDAFVVAWANRESADALAFDRKILRTVSGG